MGSGFASEVAWIFTKFIYIGERLSWRYSIISRGFIYSTKSDLVVGFVYVEDEVMVPVFWCLLGNILQICGVGEDSMVSI